MISDEQFYQRLFYSSLNDRKLLLKNLDISPCFLALVYAVSGEVEKAEEVIVDLAGVSCDHRVHKMACAEAKMAIAYAHHNLSDAKKQAEIILSEYPEAAYAALTLARIALLERKPVVALDYYEKLLNNYSDHNELILDAAKALHLLRRYSESIERTKQATPSLRRAAYQIVLPLGTPTSLIVLWLGASILAVLSGFDAKIYAALEIFLVTGAILLGSVDSLLFAILLYSGLVTTIAWFLCRWIW